MADRRFLTLRKTIMFYICIGNFFLLFGCAKTEMVSEDNTVTNENIVSTTGTIVIETGTQDAIQPSTDQPPEATSEYKIIMVGDVLLHTPVEESCLQPDGSYDYDSLFSNTKEEIAAADLALVNQEVIIGGADLGISGYPCFNADYSLCDSLVGAGFDVICHATNHAMDKGRAGLVNCAEYWRDEYPQITVLGIHDTADTSTSCGADPAIIELGDMRIAVLNYTYGTNGISLPADMPYAVDLLNEEQVAADGITFTKFLTAVAARTGELLNYSNIAGDVGVSEPTIKNWISILERTGIVYLLQPYSASALKRAIKTPKLYFRDTGLACYLTRWLTADTLKCSAVAGNMFETFVVSEILKSYSNEGKDYRFNIFYYRGKDRNASGENEIDLVIEEDGVLYPVEIKMSGNPKASMGATNQVLDKVSDKKRGLGVILCLIDKKTYLRENLVALPIEFI